MPTRLAALFLLVLGFLPLASWIPDGRAAPWFGLVLQDWLLGGSIVLGATIVTSILARGRHAPAAWRDLLGRLASLWERHPARCAWGVALLALPLYLTVASALFDRRPLLIDEVAQTIQAHSYAAGRLGEPTGPHPEFTRVIHMVEHGGLTFSQYPPGWPLLLALGVLVGAAWVVGPLCAALAVAAFGLLARRAEPRPLTALGATVLFAVTPFFVAMAGTHMGHVPGLMFALWGGVLVASAAESDRPRPGAAFLCGLAIGAAGSIRTVDALAFALPTGVWFLLLAARDRRRWLDVLAGALGLLGPACLVLWINAHTTGKPLLFGYSLLWGPAHDLGFHVAPWGGPHTPQGGVELINLYFLRLQSFLFETPVPSLLPAAVALWLARRTAALDRWLLASAALVVLVYWAYWHEAFLWGPRYVFPLIPLLVLWTARLPGLAHDAFADPARARRVRGAVLAAYAWSAVGALVVAIPFRVRQYAGSFPAQRWNLDSASAAAGVHDAVVLVREGWLFQLSARLWALGVPHSEAEVYTRKADFCRLEERLGQLEAMGARGSRAIALLRPLLRDSAYTHEITTGFETAVIRDDRVVLTPRCVRRLESDSAGVGSLPAALLVHSGGNVYVRDLDERNPLMLAEYPGRPVWRLRRATPSPWAPPLFERVR